MVNNRTLTEQIVTPAAYGAAAGGVFGFGHALWYMRPINGNTARMVPFSAALPSIAQRTMYGGLVGLSYSIGKTSMAIFRNEDDCLNSSLGGFFAGVVVSLKQSSLHRGLHYGISFGAAAIAADYCYNNMFLQNETFSTNYTKRYAHE